MAILRGRLLPSGRRWAPVALVPAALVTALSLSLPGTTSAAQPPVTVAAVADSPATDWAMFHRDQRHTGVAPGSTLSSTNVASVSPLWQSHLGDASYSSPVVSYVPSLGRSLVIVGAQNSALSAFDVATGERVWVRSLGAQVASTPAVSGGVVYVGSSNQRIYALNVVTGAVICSALTTGNVTSSPVVVSVNNGPLVMVGESGPTGSDDGGHFWAMHGVKADTVADCSIAWSFSAFSTSLAGVWSPAAYALDADGRPLVVFGSSSPEGAVYALDARTGARRWSFTTEAFPDGDVGAGPTISPPGMNGFAGGAVYIAGKDRIVYALNLTTGAKIWEFRIAVDSPNAGGWTRSTAALVGNRVYVGYGRGVYSLDALTGRRIWRTETTSAPSAEVISSPAVSGPAGARVLFVGDVAGRLFAYDQTTGALRWSFTTGATVYASPAVSGDRMFVSSADGFLYAFALPTGQTPPSTTLSTPSAGASLPSPPGGALTISGSAAAATSVGRVMVALRDENALRWWNAATGTWVREYAEQAANLATADAATTGWSTGFPATAGGGRFTAYASAVDSTGRRDPSWERTSFTVAGRGEPPTTTITSPTEQQVYRYPGDVPQVFSITLSGTAADPGGALRGVASVRLVVRNLEHNEYYCAAQCVGVKWRTTPATVYAQLASPGAASTGWTLTFPSYDHDHSYSVQAYAVDRDGEADTTPALVGTFCVRGPTGAAC